MERNGYYPPVVGPPVRPDQNQLRQFFPDFNHASDEQRQLLIGRTALSLDNVRPVGLGDNDPNYRRWLEESEVYRILIFEHVNLPPFTTEVVTDPRASAIVYFYAIGRLLSQRIDRPGLDMALACAEFLMPMINLDLLAPQDVSRRILVESVQALMTNGRRLNQEVRTVNAAWQLAIVGEGGINTSRLAEIWNNDPQRCPFSERNPVPADLPISPERAANMTPDEAMIYLIFLAQHYPVRSLPVQMLATTYVACAKQGQITLAFATKIERGIEDELGYQVTINTDTVQLLFQHFGKNFDDITAPVAFNRWQEMLPDSALRLRLTIEQVTFSRLTVYKVIEEALQTFPTFRWPLMNKLLPGDVPHFIRACELIDHNPYYGYKKDIGDAASTRYKSLGWVAKELLIRGAGKGTLANYAGWPRTIPNMERIRRIINRFLDRLSDAAAIEDGDIALAHDMLGLCIQNYNPEGMADIWRGEEENEED